MSDIHPISASTTVFIEIEKVIEREEFSDYPASEIVHFAGYASGLSPHPAVTEFFELCEDKRYFAFDGDDLHVSSFTMQMVFLAALKLKNRAEIYMLAFRNENEIDGFKASWHQKVVDIDHDDLSKSAITDASSAGSVESGVQKLKMIVVKLPPPTLDKSHPDYYALHGLAAMQNTQAQTVLCMGGGLTLRKQFELCKAHNPADMRWILFPHRRSKDGGATFEELGLHPFVGSGVHVLP